MNLPLLPGPFAAVRDVFGHQAVAHLRLAQRLPLRLRCAGVARYADPDLGRWSFEREIELASCADLLGAMSLAETSVAAGTLACGRDNTLRLAPEFIIILDAEQTLALAGEVTGERVCWCQPVQNDTEARSVVLEASRRRAEAVAISDDGDAAADAELRRRARALEGRLVDPFWREMAHLALHQARAA